MKLLTHWYFKLLEALIVVCMAAMCIMVFGNVVLRHVFDSGINVSEELSRFAFIWLTFLGAIVAMREGGHLGMDMVVRLLSRRARRCAQMASQLLILACCGVLLWGMVMQHDINAANIGLVTGISLGIVYSVASLCAVSIGIMTIGNIILLLRGHELPDPMAVEPV